MDCWGTRRDERSAAAAPAASLLPPNPTPHPAAHPPTHLQEGHAAGLVSVQLLKPPRRDGLDGVAAAPARAVPHAVGRALVHHGQQLALVQVALARGVAAEEGILGGAPRGQHRRGHLLLILWALHGTGGAWDACTGGVS